MAKEFADLNKALMKVFTPKMIEKVMAEESAMYKMLREQQQEISKQFSMKAGQYGTRIPSIPPEKKMNGEQIVQVETPEGPMIYEFVEEVNYLDNGGLEVNVLHDGNRTAEVFPKDQWTHCTTKHLVNEALTESKIEAAHQRGMAKIAAAPQVYKADLNIGVLTKEVAAAKKTFLEKMLAWGSDLDEEEQKRR
jgi:hypothetical protein